MVPYCSNAYRRPLLPLLGCTPGVFVPYLELLAPMGQSRSSPPFTFGPPGRVVVGWWGVLSVLAVCQQYAHPHFVRLKAGSMSQRECTRKYQKQPDIELYTILFDTTCKHEVFMLMRFVETLGLPTTSFGLVLNVMSMLCCKNKIAPSKNISPCVKSFKKCYSNAQNEIKHIVHFCLSKWNMFYTFVCWCFDTFLFTQDGRVCLKY